MQASQLNLRRHTHMHSELRSRKKNKLNIEHETFKAFAAHHFKLNQQLCIVLQRERGVYVFVCDCRRCSAASFPYSTLFILRLTQRQLYCCNFPVVLMQSHTGPLHTRRHSICNLLSMYCENKKSFIARCKCKKH